MAEMFTQTICNYVFYYLAFGISLWNLHVFLAVSISCDIGRIGQICLIKKCNNLSIFYCTGECGNIILKKGNFIKLSSISRQIESSFSYKVKF